MRRSYARSLDGCTGVLVVIGNMTDLKPYEVELRGSWIYAGTYVRADAVSERIEWLCSSRLVRLALDRSGWETLYLDPNDNRLWERTFPQSEMHGGGPPTLRLIAPSHATEKYGVEPM